jgi:hypothetical protein
MLRDSRILASLYLENTPAIATPAIKSVPPAIAPTITQTTQPVLPNEAGEEKKEKELPEDNWIRFKHVLKSDADIDEAAVKIARLLDNVSADRSVANEIVRLIRVKNNKYNR